MQYYTEISACHWPNKSAVTLGKFDSLHRGHQKLISRVREVAQKENLKSVVFAFDMKKDTLLTNEERRIHLENQVDCMLECSFTKEIQEMPAECFIEDVLVQKLHAAYIVVGRDFRFGYQKKGDPQMLEHYAKIYGYAVEVIDKETYGGREISSTYIRETLQSGDIELANTLLGYAYHITGIVQHGKKLGRTLGFPTMNIHQKKRKIVPRFGVYACKVYLDGGMYNGIGNVGMKPTVTEKNEVLTEVFVFDYKGDAYGKKIAVEFYDFERPEMKFASVEELKEQVNADIAYGKNYFQTDSARL